MAKTKTVVTLKDGTTTELSNLSSAEIKELVKLVKKKRKVVGDDASISSDSVDDLPLINKKQKTSSSSGKQESESKSKKVESTSKISSAEKKSKTSGVVSKKTTVSVKDAKKTSTSNPTIQNKTCRESAKKSSTLSKKKEKSGNVAMGNKHNGDSPMGSKQSSKSQSKKATISLLDDSDDEKKKTTGSRKIPRKKTLLKNSPSQKSICGTVSAQPDTPHPHSLNDDHTQSPSSMSNGSGRSCHTEVAEFSEESLSDGQKMSFPSQTGRHKNTSFESIITNMSNDKGMNDTYFEVSRI